MHLCKRWIIDFDSENISRFAYIIWGVWGGFFFIIFGIEVFRGSMTFYNIEHIMFIRD